MAAKRDNIKKAVLAALLVLLAGYWVTKLSDRTEQPNAVKPGVLKLGSHPPAKFPKVDLAQLEKLNVPVKVTRNIFDPIYMPPKVEPIKPVAPTPPPAGIPTGNKPKPPPPPPPSREELDAKKAEDEIKQFKFTGFVSRKDKLDIFLSHRNDFVVARPGEDMEMGDSYAGYRFYVKEVFPNSLVIADRAHQLNGKEVEAVIPADFEGKDIDIITNASAPYVGAGATGGSMPGKSESGATESPNNRPDPSRQRSRGPAGGKRAPAAPPRVVEVPVTVGGPAAQPLEGGTGGEEDSGFENTGGEEGGGGEEEEPGMTDGGQEDDGGGTDVPVEVPGGTEIPDGIQNHSL